MAGYKEIKGFQVQTRTSDPAPYAQALADNPYAGVWSSVGNVNTARLGSGAAGANNSAALIFGGAPSNKNHTEQYNGSSWTELNNLNHGRQYLGGQGTYTAAIAFGGEEPGLTGNTELWDGTNWT